MPQDVCPLANTPTSIDLILRDTQNPSFVLTKPNHVTYENRPIPTIESPHDVIVAVKYTGICGSDVHYWHEGRIGDFIVKEPMVLGHESSGTIHAVGSAVKNLQPGDNVAMEPGIPCRYCTRCKSGLYNLCPETRFAATPPIDGTLARFYRLPGDFCYKLPTHVSLQEGALIEPLAVAVHIVRQAPVSAGQAVVVFGAGPVGLLCLAVARAFGASRTISVDINANRLDFAKKYAATSTFTPRQDEDAQAAAARLRQENNLVDGADVTIDASGAAVCMRQAIFALRPAGTYVQGGMGKPEVDAWPVMAIMAKEIECKTSFRYKSGDYETALELVASGKLDVKPCISREVDFLDAEAAFGDTRAAKGIKTLIKGPA